MTTPRASEDMDRDALLKYEVREGTDGKVGIYLRAFNVCVAKFADNSASVQADFAAVCNRTAPADSVKPVDRGPVTPASEGWQPIKSAPKGVRILTWDDFDGGRAEIMTVDHWEKWRSLDGLEGPPKFWQSLPGAPT